MICLVIAGVKLVQNGKVLDGVGAGQSSQTGHDAAGHVVGG